MKLFSHLSVALVALPLAAWAIMPGAGTVSPQDVSANGAPDFGQSEDSADLSPAGPDMAWVDPVITGPVSPEYKRIREAAHCDTAKWPDIPDVCYPD